MPTPDIPPPAAGGTPPVLVVEDEPARRDDICRMVRGLGYRARAARNGPEAIRYLREHPGEIRLVLSDLIMPYMDGGELAERIRDLLPGMRIVLMTSSPDREAAELLAAYPELPVLMKPFTLAELYATLVWQLGPPTLPAGPRPRAPVRRPSREHRT